MFCKYERHGCSTYRQLTAAGGLRTVSDNKLVTSQFEHHRLNAADEYSAPAGEKTFADAYGTAAGVDRHNGARDCATQHSVRVYHHKHERRALLPSGSTSCTAEGHHCKLVSNACTCRCHNNFRHDYNPKWVGLWRHYEYDAKCGG